MKKKEQNKSSFLYCPKNNKTKTALLIKYFFIIVYNIFYMKLMKEKVLRKHEKTAASVLLKLFISSNEWCHTTDAPSAWADLHVQM